MKIIYAKHTYTCPYCWQHVRIIPDADYYNIMECRRIAIDRCWHRMKGDSNLGELKGYFKLLPDKPIVRVYENNIHK